MYSAPRGTSALERRRGGSRVRVCEAVSGLGCGRSLDQKGCFVVSALASAFGGKSEDVGEMWALGRGVIRQRRRGVQR